MGVFGSPIAHTASPAIHNAAFAALEMNWRYLAFHVESQHLMSALTGARDMGLAGVNLTVPHKVLALDLVEEVDTEARRLGAINAVVMESGKLRGFNTDGYGIVKALKEEFNFTLRGRRVLVLGAGGAGRGIAVKCALEGARKVFVANRTPAKTEPIHRELHELKVECQSLPMRVDDLAGVMGDVDLVINATSVGLKEGDSLGLPGCLFSPRLFVYDTIYRPVQTELLRRASEAGAKTANGASMLLHQGAKSFELWTKRKAPIAVMRRALKAALSGETA